MEDGSSPDVILSPLAAPAAGRDGGPTSGIAPTETDREALPMGLWDTLKNEFIDIIEWLDPSRDTMVWRYPRNDNEIKNGAKLVVRESQTAVFVNEGQIADVFDPGTHDLTTANLPILAKLKGWKYGFESPFKAEVYFVNTRRFVDLKWGTKNPIMLRDPEFGPTRIRAFGTYAIKVQDAPAFLREVVGTDGDFRTDEITEQIRNIITTRFADSVAEAKIPVLDLAANYNELGDLLRDTIQEDMNNYGLELTKMLVENISLPEAVEKVLDQRTSMGVIGDLSRFTQFKAAEAIGDAAKNEGMAGGGMSMGMGFAMANQMAGAMNPGQQGSGGNPSATPPPLPGSSMSYFVAQGGAQTGPFDQNHLSQLVSTRSLNADTLVWKAGMGQWTRAGDVPEMAALLAQVPPPLPPQ